MVEIMRFIANELGENAQEIKEGATRADAQLREAINKSVDPECSAFTNLIFVRSDTYKTAKKKTIEAEYKKAENKFLTCFKKSVLK
jgi:hypothetical protein